MEREQIKALARSIDLSCVQASNTLADVEAMAKTARKLGCAAAFALPSFTPALGRLLQGSQTRLGGAVGFPGGGATTAMKAAEARELVRMGCAELDMVMNLGKLRSGLYREVGEDIEAVVAAAAGRPVKVILEVTLLSAAEIAAACEIVVKAGGAFVKTGTGWMPQPTTLQHVRLIHQVVGGRVGIKAAGGIRDLSTLLAMRREGCSRFGLGAAHALRVLRQAGLTESF